ncbi:hypothetical protein [Nocardioides aurantiacus]|uniref:hypothetical protein n=1 Tax=Nocardioides aurantiacus TaxID=86796 RepID=UPI00403F61DB
MTCRSNGRQTVSAYGERWLARQMIAPSTAGAYRTVLHNHVYPEIGPVRLDAITRADVQALVNAWASASAPRTVEGRYSILAILLRAAVKDRVIPASPCVDIKPPEIPPKSALVPISTATCSPSARPSRPLPRLRDPVLGPGCGGASSSD